jgi:Arc/MetJ-type ribon-helix-helix transcriptional regulator
LSMAKEEAKTDVNRSEFIRSALTKDPDLNHRQINLLWSQAGHAGEITKVLFYQVRRKMGLKRAEYRWVLDDDRR